MNEAPIQVGAELQRAREARGLALSEVAQQLKFAPRQLEALEEDRFDLLPGGTFARGMVRNYARLLKIDPEPLVRRVAEHFEPPDADTLAARYSQPVPFSDSARRSTFVYLGLSLGVLSLGGAVAWQWYQERQRAPVPLLARAQPPVVTPKAPPPRTAAAVEKRVEARRPAPRPSAADTAAKAAPIEAAAAAEPQEASGQEASEEKAVERKATEPRPLPVADVPAGLHRLVIRCDEEAWIEVRDDEDRALISSLNPAGTERALRARGPLKLVIGNARHVTILHNDQPLDLAPYIKVETARFTLP